MAALERFKRLNDKVSSGFEWVGLIAFVFMMVLTTVDVIGAKLFLFPLPGSIDFMMLAQLIAMSFAFSASYIANRHVQVEFFVPLLPKSVQRINACIIQLVVLILFIIMAWRLFIYGYDLKMYSEVSSTIRIPLYPYTYAAAVAFIPVCMVALAKWIQTVCEVFKNES